MIKKNIEVILHHKLFDHWIRYSNERFFDYFFFDSNSISDDDTWLVGSMSARKRPKKLPARWYLSAGVFGFSIDGWWLRFIFANFKLNIDTSFCFSRIASRAVSSSANCGPTSDWSTSALTFCSVSHSVFNCLSLSLRSLISSSSSSFC